MAGQAILGETVLKQARASDADSLAETVEALVAQHTPMVFRIAFSILRNHQDAEDAVQECFLRVLKAQSRRHAVRNAKTWLARIAWTTALDQRSRRAASAGNEQVLDDDALAQLPAEGRGWDEQVERREMQALLERMIAALPEDLRQPLELSTVQELNSAEIAEVMEIPESSVRTRLFRARGLLKEKLASIESAAKEARNHG
jgi:RNA polymerase sigma-70 factor (ECF subfamily)